MWVVSDFDGNEFLIEEIDFSYGRWKIGRLLFNISLEIFDYEIVFIEMESLVGSLNYFL